MPSTYDSALWSSIWSVLVSQGAGAIILFAGLAEGLGTQSIVLLVNRITPLRFVLNLLLSVAFYMLSAIIWMALIWLVATYVLRAPAPFPRVIAVVSLAYVPLLFSTLALIPYIGPLINAILQLWSLVVALSAISVVFGFSLAESLLCGALGWMLLETVRFLLGRPADRLGHWLWVITTGRDRRISLNELPLLINDIGAAGAEARPRAKK